MCAPWQGPQMPPSAGCGLQRQRVKSSKSRRRHRERPESMKLLNDNQTCVRACSRPAPDRSLHHGVGLGRPREKCVRAGVDRCHTGSESKWSLSGNQPFVKSDTVIHQPGVVVGLTCHLSLLCLCLLWLYLKGIIPYG